jgi:hypothetical protein
MPGPLPATSSTRALNARSLSYMASYDVFLTCSPKHLPGPSTWEILVQGGDAVREDALPPELAHMAGGVIHTNGDRSMTHLQGKCSYRCADTIHGDRPSYEHLPTSCGVIMLADFMPVFRS